jgi:hypothetical protein
LKIQAGAMSAHDRPPRTHFTNPTFQQAKTRRPLQTSYRRSALAATGLSKNSFKTENDPV